MTSQSSLDIPPLPSIDKVKPLALEKICPICSSDNNPTAVLCANCGGDIAATKAMPKQRKRDDKGSQKGQNRHEVMFKGMPINKMHVPGFGVSAQVPYNANLKPIKPIKPIKPKRQMISDDDVEVVDENHLNNIQNSANNLGL